LAIGIQRENVLLCAAQSGSHAQYLYVKDADNGMQSACVLWSRNGGYHVKEADVRAFLGIPQQHPDPGIQYRGSDRWQLLHFAGG
jgi:hypothetical protein